MIPVNIWAVLVCGIVAMFIGFVWYGPLFGKQWVASMGWSPERMQEAMKKSSHWSYLLMFVGALLMSFILAHGVIFTESYLGSTGASIGALVGFGSWLGFVVPSSIGGVLWEGKPWKWWIILSGYYLVTLVILGVILAVWM
jgi:hypothetical protein